MSKNQRKIIYAVLAVILSSVLWLYVSVITDPEGQTEIRAVPITFVGEEILNSRNLYIIENITGTLRLTFDGRRTDRAQLNNTNVSAVVDLSNITTTGTSTRAYDVKIPDNLVNSVKAIDRVPQYVDLFIDKIETKIVDVRPVLMITPAEGYIVDNEAAAMEPHEVRIRGPLTILDKIEYAEIAYNREGVTQSVDTVISYKYKDADGNEVSSENIEPDYPEVRLSVPVNKTKTVALDVDFRDGGGITLADNVNYDISPKEITISGDPAIIEDINVIKVPQIDLSKVASSGDREYKITLPNGCENLSGTESAVVSIEIIGVQTQLINVTNFEVVNESPPEGYSVSVLSEAAMITIRGPENAVKEVAPHNIRIVADLAGIELKPGQTWFAATVHIDGFPNVGAVGEYRVAVNIRRQAD